MKRGLSFLFLCLAIIAHFMGIAQAGEDGTRAYEIVQRYGENIGGPESIGSLVTLNMRDWKPQSSKGIEIFGWHWQSAGPFKQNVVYSYNEHGANPVQILWQVDLKRETILPLNVLGERIMQMARVL